MKIAIIIICSNVDKPAEKRYCGENEWKDCWKFGDKEIVFFSKYKDESGKYEIKK